MRGRLGTAKGRTVAALTALTFAFSAAAAASAEAAPNGENGELDLTPLNFRTFAIGGPHVALSDELTTTVINPAALDTVGFHIGLNGGVTTKLFDLMDAVGDLEEDPGVVENLTGDYPANGLAQVGFRKFGLSGLASASAHVSHATHDGTEDKYEYEEVEYGAKFVGGGQVGLALPVFDAPFGLGSLSVGVSARMLQGVDTSNSMNATPPSVLSSLIEEGEIDPDNPPSDVLDKIEGTQKSAEYDGSGMAFGVGALVRATDWVSVGVALNDLAYRMEWEGEETTQHINKTRSLIEQSLVWEDVDEESGPDSFTETRDPSWQIGVSVQPPLLGLVAAADLHQDGTISYGLEKSLFFGLLSLRAGQIQPGDGSDAITSGGVGVNLGPVQMGVAARTSDFGDFEGLAGAAIKF